MRRASFIPNVKRAINGTKCYIITVQLRSAGRSSLVPNADICGTVSTFPSICLCGGPASDGLGFRGPQGTPGEIRRW
jgi:hypothetical protein